MSVIVNEVRRGTYLDSVALMRVARTVAVLSGVEDAGLMIGTPANRDILRDARVLNAVGETAGPGDLILAIRACDQIAADAAMLEARRLIEQPRHQNATGAQVWRPRTLRAAVAQATGANLALISVAGDFAIAEARKALHAGLHVMIFSDNIPLADEVQLKREALELGLMVMGPDCGTAIIGGVPLAFANVVPRGDIGIIGASGTGIQEVSCLIARAGRGISHAIGTGGRDLKAEVGGITTLMAIDALDADPATNHIVLISKPPADEVAAKVLDRVAKSAKPFTICFLGDGKRELPINACAAPSLWAAAMHACGQKSATSRTAALAPRRGFVRGLFAGGTFAAEAQIVFQQVGLKVNSNVPVPGAGPLGDLSLSHAMVDLGADEYTRGRPHPMIEPAVRDASFAEALADPNVGIILLDCVLGYGGHEDPAGHIIQRLMSTRRIDAAIVASVTGTDADPQNWSTQVAKLQSAGVIVAVSNAEAAGLAAAAVTCGD